MENTFFFCIGVFVFFYHTVHQKILNSIIRHVYLLIWSQHGTVETPLDMLFKDVGQSPGCCFLQVFAPSDLSFNFFQSQLSYL